MYLCVNIHFHTCACVCWICVGLDTRTGAYIQCDMEPLFQCFEKIHVFFGRKLMVACSYHVVVHTIVSVLRLALIFYTSRIFFKRDKRR